MVINMLCWLWIALSAFSFGIAGLGILQRINRSQRKETDMIMVLGVCLLTVFAQFFSLFYKVGALATLFLVILNIVFLCVFHRDVLSKVSVWKNNKNILYIILIVVLLALVFLNYASDTINAYDTYLYHAQSIRWIEEYGVVPGLGNLHHRLAYNNSNFSLQALFSFSFLLDCSLHSINGFIGLLFISYAVCSLKVLRTHLFHVSDFFRGGLISYIVSQAGNISSPTSDFFAISIILYIFIKWITLLEEGESDSEQYICLCLIGVFAMSVKLSATMMVLLAIVPAVRLIKEKKWRNIGIYIVFGVIMILPYLARNVIISGYMIYPYPEFDLFRFDWKMPEFSLIFDRHEIKAWGMGVNNYERYNAPLSEWFPIWKESLNRLQLLEVYLLPLLAIVSMGIAICKFVKYKIPDYICVVLTMIATISLWFFGAPGLRFGGIFLILLPCFVLGNLAERLNGKTRINGFPMVIMLVFVVYNISPVIGTIIKGSWDNKVWGKDYDKLSCSETYLDTELLYIPDEGDQTGYYAFPSLPYEDRLSIIELRDGNIKKGFKMKEEYENAFVSNYGWVSEENIFE